MRRIAHALAVATLLLCSGGGLVLTQAPRAATFASQVAALSEPGGYFDTDNLISNERSYLDVLPELRSLAFTGGAYIGVGPDQNFTYIAAVKPDIAFIVDIRRDNLLLHLLFKSLFLLARTRAEYLCLLLGRPVPADVESWRDASIERIVTHLDGRSLDAKEATSLRKRVDAAIARIGVALSTEDRATIDRFHQRFIEAGAELRFQSIGRPPQSHYPTYRDLLLEREPGGGRGNYLAAEEAFQFVRDLQKRDLIIPVVGDLGGQRALASIGALLKQRKQRVSAFYTSNVEFYLFSDGRFPGFVDNLDRIPLEPKGVIIRSIFGRYAGWGASKSRLQPIASVVNGFRSRRFQGYSELINFTGQ